MLLLFCLPKYDQTVYIKGKSDQKYTIGVFYSSASFSISTECSSSHSSNSSSFDFSFIRYIIRRKSPSLVKIDGFAYINEKRPKRCIFATLGAEIV